MSDSLAELVTEAAADEALAAEMRAFYAELDETINVYRPVCTNRGACCRFGEYGHRLYATSVELAYFARGAKDDPRLVDGRDACPYQVGGQCTAREHRPMGCRVFFCDPGAQHWQNDEYERQLARLKAIGERHGVPYRYAEWLSALEALHGSAPNTENTAPPSIDRRSTALIQLTQVRSTDPHRQQGLPPDGDTAGTR